MKSLFYMYKTKYTKGKYIAKIEQAAATIRGKNISLLGIVIE